MNRLAVRLSLAFLGVALLAVLVVGGLLYNAFQRGFTQYLLQQDRALVGEEFLDDLLAQYARSGDWAQVVIPPTRMMGRQGGRGPGQGPGQGQGQPAPGIETFLADAEGRIVRASVADWEGQFMEAIGLSRIAPLMQAGRVVGYWGEQSPNLQNVRRAEASFRSDSQRALVAAILVSAALALALGVGLAWTLAHPLRQLRGGLARIAQGDLQVRLTPRGADEIRDLSEGFNAMAEQLRRQIALREQMAADVAHELRTPVSVLRGHLEAMMDGIYPLELGRIATAYDQTIQLAHLVEDLRLLTSAQAGALRLNLGPLDLNSFLGGLIERFEPLALDEGVQLRAELSPLPLVRADAMRLGQIFNNLLDNALRHVGEGGTIRIVAQRQGQRICVQVANDGPPLRPEQLDHLFERFWRGDEARQRDQGGTGLGLAIARQLAQVQGGDLSVASETGWTVFSLTLLTEAPA